MFERDDICSLSFQGFRIAAEKGTLTGHKVSGVKFILLDGGCLVGVWWVTSQECDIS